jgi:hypothetical protein
MAERIGPDDAGPQQLRQRMLRARRFHEKYVHHAVWSCPKLVRSLMPPPGRLPLRVLEADLVALIRLDHRLREPPHNFSPLRFEPGLSPRLNPIEREIRETNQIAYVSPDRSLQLTRGELRGIGRVMSDERWVRLLCTFPPTQSSFEMGLNGKSPRTVEQLIQWLMHHTRVNEQEYSAACLDMYYAGEATRLGTMPAATSWKVALMRADLAEGRARAWNPIDAKRDPLPNNLVEPHTTWVHWRSRSIKMEQKKERLLNVFHHSELIFTSKSDTYVASSGQDKITGLNWADLKEKADPEALNTIVVAVLPKEFNKIRIAGLIKAWNAQSKPYSPVNNNCNTFASWMWAQLGLKPVDLDWQLPR